MNGTLTIQDMIDLLIETYPEAASEIRTDVIETMQRFLERDVIQFI